MSLVIKTEIVQLVAYAKENGITKRRSCSLIRISRRRVERWELKAREKGSMADRTPGPIHANHAVVPSEKQALLEYISRKETVDYSLQMIALKGAEENQFFMSASTVRTILCEAKLASDRRSPRRRTGSGKKPNRPDELTGPNQCWCWDISYLPTDVPRWFWYLYVMLDEWSRKVVAWRVCRHITAEESLALIDDAFLSENLLDLHPESRPVVVNDRGSQMKEKKVKRMFRDLGLPQEFARPRTPNDNPFIESLFSTVKTALLYPGWFSSAKIEIPRSYFERYFLWYNFEHFHSRIGFVHPIDKHEGRAETIIAKRKEQLTKQKKNRILFWTETKSLTGNGL